MGKVRKKPYFIVIDLYNMKNTVIKSTIMDVAEIVKVHRNTISIEDDGIYQHYIVLPRNIE